RGLPCRTVYVPGRSPPEPPPPGHYPGGWCASRSTATALARSTLRSGYLRVRRHARHLGTLNPSPSGAIGIPVPRACRRTRGSSGLWTTPSTGSVTRARMIAMQVEEVLAELGGAATRAELLARVPEGALRRAVAAGSVERPARGRYRLP